MLELKNITFSYEDHTVIQNLSHKFPEKGIVALMGGSGEGKTTLLRLVSALERPRSGNVLCNYRKNAYAFQEPRLIPWMTCLENIKFVLSKEEQNSKLPLALMRAMELDGLENAYPEELSGGMKQRLSLCRALAVKADLLLLDEPFSALDQPLRKRIAPLIKAANPEGLTLLVTHDREDAALLDATILTLHSVQGGSRLL